MVKCQACGEDENLTPVVYSIILWSHGLPDGIWHLTCAEDYRICDNDGCESVLHFLRRAIDSHPTTRQVADLWTHAQVNWSTPLKKPWQVEHKRPEIARA